MTNHNTTELMQKNKTIRSKIRDINAKYNTNINVDVDIGLKYYIYIYLDCEISYLARKNTTNHLPFGTNIIGEAIFIQSENYDQVINYLDILEKEIERIHRIRLFL